MMVLKGFFDDSGKGSGRTDGDVYTLAGFLSTAEKWQRFSDDWKNFEAEDPRTPDFHMVDAFHMRRKYDFDVMPERRDSKVAGFVQLIKRHAMYRISSTVAKPYYEELVRGRVPLEIDDPYFVLYYSVIFSAAHFMDVAGIDGTMDLIFDVQGLIGTTALLWYDFVKTRSADLAARMRNAPTFQNDSSVLPLKSADIFAWQLRRHLDKELPFDKAHNEDLDSLMAIPGAQSSIDREELRVFVEGISEGLNLNSRVKLLIPRKRIMSVERDEAQDKGRY